MKRLLFSIAFLGFVAVSMAAQDISENSENGVSYEIENLENGGLSDFLSQVIREQHTHARHRGWSLDKRNALGLKFGNYTVISFQRVLNNQNRLEFNAGQRIDNPLTVGAGVNSILFNVSGLHQWGWGLRRLSSGFIWYIGIGAGAHIGSEERWWNGIPTEDDFIEGGRERDSIFRPRVIGNIGIEYSFPNFPLQFALDYTPFVGIYREEFREHTHIFENIGLAIRWRF